MSKLRNETKTRFNVSPCQCVHTYSGTNISLKRCSFSYLCVDYVVLDLVLCDGDVLQNDLQPHRHHAGHPVDQTGADVTGHSPLESQGRFTVKTLQVFRLSLLFG